MEKKLWEKFNKELQDNKWRSMEEVDQAIEEKKICEETSNFHRSYIQILIFLQRKIPSMLIQYMTLFVEEFIDKKQRDALLSIEQHQYIRLSLYNEIVTSLYMLVENGQGKDKTLTELLPKSDRYKEVGDRLKKLRNGINHFKLDMYNGKITEVSFKELFLCYLILVDEIDINYGKNSPLWINSFSDLGFKVDKTESESKIWVYYTITSQNTTLNRGVGKGQEISALRKELKKEAPGLIDEFNDISRETQFTIDERLVKMKKLCSDNGVNH